MADSVETGRSQVVDPTAEARASVELEINQADSGANPVQKREELSENLRKELQNVKDSAVNYIVMESNARGGRAVHTPETSQQGEEALKSLVRFMWAAEKGLLVAKTPEANLILPKLAHRNLQLSQAAAIEMVMTDYLIGTKNIVDLSTEDKLNLEFKNDYQKLGQVDPTSARYILESIIEAQIPGLEDNEIRKALKIKESSDGKNHRRPTMEERDSYVRLHNKIVEAQRKAIESTGTVNEEDPNFFSSNDNYAVSEFLFGDVGDSARETKVNQALHKLNITQAELNEYRRLREIMFGPSDDYEYLMNYTPGYRPYLEKAKSEFSLENIKEKYLMQDPKTGKLIFSREKRLEFQDLIQKYYWFALRDIHRDPSKPFQTVFSESQEAQYYFSILKQIISKSCNDLSNNHFTNDPDTREFLKDKSSRYQTSIKFLSQIFQDLPLYARDIGSFEKLPEIMGNLFPSELGEIFDDKDRFMEITRGAITTEIRKLIVKAGNKQPADIFSGEYDKKGVRWGINFDNSIRDIIIKKAKRLNIPLGEESENSTRDEKEWKLDRARVYGPGLGLATLADIEVLTTADPAGHFKDVHPWSSALSAKFKWLGGRGDPAAGVISKYLLSMPVTLFPEQRGFFKKLFFKKSWIPEKFKRMVDDQVTENSDLILKNLFDKGSSYQELLSLINISSSLISRGGWRMEAIKNELLGTFAFEKPNLPDASRNWEEWGPKEWKEIYDISVRDYGNASLWWFNSSGLERINKEMKRLVLDHFHGDRDETAKEFEKFSPERPEGNEALKKIKGFFIEGKESDLNYLQIRLLRTNQIRGEEFYRYMRRNPGDFFLLMSQMVPELAVNNLSGTDINKYGLNDHETKLANSGILLNDADWEHLKAIYSSKFRKTENEIEQLEARRGRIRETWGNKTDGHQFETLIKMRKWVLFSKDTLKPRLAQKAGKDLDKFDFSINDFIDQLMTESSSAFEKLHKENENYLGDPTKPESRAYKIDELKKRIDNTGDFIEKKRLQNEIADLKKGIRLYVTKDDFRREVDRDQSPIEQEMINSIFEGNGLFNVMTNQRYEQLDEEDGLGYFKSFGSYKDRGDLTAFYYMGQGWSMKEGDINPFSSDFNHYAVFSKLGKPGEQVIKRYMGDAAAVNKMLDKVVKLEDLLVGIKTEADFEKIYELHHEVFHTLQGIIGKEYAYKANNIIAQIVTNYFLQHDITRNVPLKYLFLSYPAKLLLGKNVSLSKILGNIHTYSMDENALRTYYMNLKNNHCLPHEGAWSEEHLDKVYDADVKTYIVGDFVPNFAWFVFLFLMWTYIKKAFEESEGKKK